MPYIKMEIWFAESTTEIKLNKPAKLKEILPEFARNEDEAIEFKKLAEDFLNTYKRINELLK